MTTTTAAARTLADRLDGEVLLPGGPAYDAARTIWNAAVDHRPALVVRAGSVADVATAVRTSRELGVELGVRCGGHSPVGHAVPDGGLMLDLTGLAQVDVDPGARRARVQGGALLGALDRATQSYGLATTAGNVSHTGVGGLTLGGGMGWLARLHGLACDNVEAYEVVTADGRTVIASRDEHPELFWGLRGGGGNFGVVTAFDFRLHETGTRALTVELDVPLAAAATTLRGWRDLAATAPRRATFAADLAGGVLTMGYVWVGDPEPGRALVPALRALGPVLAERVVETTYLDLQTRDDVVDGHAVRRYFTGHYLRELSDAAIDALVTACEPGPYAPRVGFQQYGGAIADVPPEDAAWARRETAFEFVSGAGWTEAAEDDERIAAARAVAAALEPYADGAYVNAQADEGAAVVRRAYPSATLARLTALKDAWDPDNVFHLNQNIAPSRGTSGPA